MSLWPQPLRQMLEGSRQSDAGNGSYALRDNDELFAEQASLKKDALLGHLLRLVAGGDGQDPHLAPQTLPALSGQLVAAGLVPR